MAAMDRMLSKLGAAMKAVAPVEIDYTRDAETITITGSLGRTVFASQSDNKARIEFGEVDVLIDAADLVLGGNVATPARSDRLVMTLNGNAMTFEPHIPDTREPSWRYSDPQRTRIRLHLKRVS